MATALEDLIKSFETKEAAARQANITRQAQITSIFDEIIARYGPEGTYGAAALEQLRGQKVRDVSAAKQTDISRGLYGVSPRETEWEAAVGAPARLKLEDIKMERLSQAQLGKAGFMERIEEPYPDYGALTAAAQAAGAGGGTMTVSGGGGGGDTIKWGTYGAPAHTTATTPARTGGGGYGELTVGRGEMLPEVIGADEPWYTVQQTVGPGGTLVPTGGLKVAPGTEGAQPKSWFAQQGKPAVSPEFRKTAQKAQSWLYGA